MPLDGRAEDERFSESHLSPECDGDDHAFRWIALLQGAPTEQRDLAPIEIEICERREHFDEPLGKLRMPERGCIAVALVI